MAIEYTHPLRYKSGTELAPVLEKNRIDLEEFLNYQVVRLESDGTVNLPLGSHVDSNDIWHAGNDGPGSGLDSDTVDTYHLADILAACAGNVMEVDLQYTTGWVLPSGALAQIYETTYSTGLTGVTSVLVDVTMQVEVSVLATGDTWGAELEVQDVLVGAPMYHGGLTRPSHTHSVSASGSTSSDSAGTPTGSVTVENHYHSLGSHGHNISGSSGVQGGSHTHDVSGTTSSGGTHTHTVTGYTTTVSSHYHWMSDVVAGSAGSHTHTWSDTSGNANEGGHFHLSGSYAADATSGNTGYYQPTGSFSGNALGGHAHSFSASGSTGAGGSGSIVDSIAVRWVGNVNTDASGNIKLACWASASSTAAVVDRIHFNGQVWVVPASIAASLGSLDDIPDVELAAEADHDVLAYDTASGHWKNMAAATAGLSPSSHSHTLDALTDVTVGTPSSGDTIVWNAGTSQWENAAPGVGALAIDDLSDVTITAVATGEVLGYTSGSGWINKTLAEAGISDTAHTHTGVYSETSHNHDSAYISVIAVPAADHFPYQTAGGELVDSGYDAADFATAVHNHDTAYISIIAAPAASHFPYQTAGGELENSGYDAADFAAAGHSHALDALSDVDAGAPTDGQVLTWDTGTSSWIADDVPTGGTHTLGEHTDVDTTVTSDGDVLTYNSGTGNWEPTAPTGGTGGGWSTSMLLMGG